MTDGLSFLSLGLQNVRSLNTPGRLPSVISEILDGDIDLFCITETWLRDGDKFLDTDLVTAGYSYLSRPRIQSGSRNLISLGSMR